ncbi:UDP-3-O-(3-hydroxymyristoyl)glucosamine N-acyltransferase [Flavobacteriales bacterium]|nr:UDP-3-O-(3-hydroxymyristoyl)glucosamine N-acyltransferase [Flavobacteriales bacterium]
MNLTAKQIAKILKGEIIGNSNTQVRSVAKIEDGKSGDLCFLSNPKYASYIYSSSASIVIVNKSFIPEKKISSTLIIVEDAYSSFSQLLDLYNKMKFKKVGVSKKADIYSNTTINSGVFIGAFTSISESASIEKDVKIHSNCYIGENVSIGTGSIIFSGVHIHHDCKIGENNIIHSGTVIGADGFGFAPDNNTNYSKISQIGNVVIGNNVEIGANTTIDRATMGSTKIGHGVKLDNLIQIGHNVEIGEHTVIAAQTGIAGSTKIGKKCMIGGQTAIAGHLTIADNVKVAGQSGIISSITEKGKIVQGPLAFDIKEFQRAYIIFKKLPEIYQVLTEIQKKNQN